MVEIPAIFFLEMLGTVDRIALTKKRIFDQGKVLRQEVESRWGPAVALNQLFILVTENRWLLTSN